MRIPQNRWLPLLGILLGWAASAAAATVDDLPPETRAALTAAACAYPPEKVSALNPADPSRFKPHVAFNYLSTNLEGKQYSARVESASTWTATVYQAANAETAAGEFKKWSAAGGTADWLEIGMPVALQRGQLFTARTQSGRWQLEVMAANEEAARAGLNTLVRNARRYSLLDGDQLLVEYLSPDGSPQRLQPGQPMRLRMTPGGQTEVAFRLSVTDEKGQPIDADALRINITLQGALASFARTESGEQKPQIEFTNVGREPVTAKWRFPSPAEKSFGDALAKTKPGGTDFSIEVEANYKSKKTPA